MEPERSRQQRNEQTGNIDQFSTHQANKVAVCSKANKVILAHFTPRPRFPFPSGYVSLLLLA